MTRYRVLVEFDGGGYCGWQSQRGAASVQDAMARAIERMSGEFTRPTAAGRTDAGVHAVALPAHFDLAGERRAAEVQGALNHHLWTAGEKIAVHGAAQVADDFHARRDAKQRRYAYRILVADAPSSLEAGRVLHLRRALDVGAMSRAAAILEGEHDFSSFRASGCQADSAARVLESLAVKETAAGLLLREGATEIVVRAAAPSFLYNQVRIIVGTLLTVGLGRMSPDDVAVVLAARDRTKAGPTAPPHGLYFLSCD
ncbi:MAG: tRNA pseudouridine(38-40) synthase TruA, partial [Alphaproteobacteria bacterium]|nr:tRNA pseudouridine(38-40) synthase TruA [Alphaproteobacteria bacterium]